MTRRSDCEDTRDRFGCCPLVLWSEGSDTASHGGCKDYRRAHKRLVGSFLLSRVQKLHV